MHAKISSAKWRPSCLDPNELTVTSMEKGCYSDVGYPFETQSHESSSDHNNVTDEI